MNISSHRTAYFNAVTAIEANGQYRVNGGGHGKMSREQLDTTGQGQARKDIKLTQSFLNSECKLNVNITTYNFNVLDNQPNTTTGVIQPTEQRLKQQDVFFCYELGFYILVRSSASGNASFKYQYMTFPNPNLFGGGINLDASVGLWTQGRLVVSVNNNVITPVWDLSQHYMAPETQIQGINSSINNLFNEVAYKEDGLVTVEPNWIINGGNNNQFVVNYPEQLTAMNFQVGAYYLSAVLVWRGFLAQNASSIMDAK